MGRAVMEINYIKTSVHFGSVQDKSLWLFFHFLFLFLSVNKDLIDLLEHWVFGLFACKLIFIANNLDFDLLNLSFVDLNDFLGGNFLLIFLKLICIVVLQLLKELFFYNRHFRKIIWIIDLQLGLNSFQSYL
jgi:hypothetical protein